jgi:hypothetical protein
MRSHRTIVVVIVITAITLALAPRFLAKAHNRHTTGTAVGRMTTRFRSGLIEVESPAPTAVNEPLQELTETNWQQHPKIVAVRSIVAAVDAGLKKGTFKVSQREFDSCWNGDSRRRIAHDAKGVVRYYETYGAGEESDRTFKKYYDTFGHLRFVYIIDRWSGIMTARIYFDENSKRFWLSYKRVKGEPQPGTFGPYDDDEVFLKSPEDDFKSPSDCREIKRNAKHRSR